MQSPQVNEVTFRCSRLGDLMTESKVKSNPLSESTKTFIRQTWLQNEFNYKEDVMTDEMMKGHLCEQDSLGLIQQVIGGEFRAKNTKRFKNDFIQGTPDSILKKEDYIEDAKSSYNLRTFTEAELSKLYYWQGQGYMWLTGKTKYRLIYCLVPTPENLIEEQKKRWWFKFGCDDQNQHYIDAATQIEHNNNIISTLAPEYRIKVFEFDFEPEKIELLKQRIIDSREYYKSLSLKQYQK